MARIAIRELTIPERAGAAGWDDFELFFRLYADAQERAYGTPDVRDDPADALPWYLDREEPKRLWIGEVDGVPLGMGEESTVADESSDVSWLDVYVDPRADGTGLADALGDVTEAAARASGASRVLCYLPSPELDGPRLDAPTGAGSVPAEDPWVRWMLGRGWRLEQVERASRLPLPVDRESLDRRLADSAAAGPQYRVLTWAGATPERWLEDFAILENRMSTDAPSAGLEEPEIPWTADRVAESDARAAGSGERITSVALHVPTGRLAGYTRLMLPLREGAPARQWATLVLKEHRGHRLGMRLKAANLAFLADERPGRPSVLTWNAEENRYMLDVNEALGFAPIGYEGAWRKDLA